MARRKAVINQLADIGIAIPADRKNFSYRKIDNGYLITISGTKSGKYFSKEFYSPKQPVINLGTGKKA